MGMREGENERKGRRGDRSVKETETRNPSPERNDRVVHPGRRARHSFSGRSLLSKVGSKE